MSKQTLVIGLGQFGMSLARALGQHGSEVLAVDTNPVHIHEIAPHVADAVIMDAMDEAALATLAPHDETPAFAPSAAIIEKAVSS